MPRKLKNCPEGTFRNPDTNRCVKYTSVIGLKVLAKYPHLKQPEPRKSRSSRKSKSSMKSPRIITQPTIIESRSLPIIAKLRSPRKSTKSKSPRSSLIITKSRPSRSPRKSPRRSLITQSITQPITQSITQLITQPITQPIMRNYQCLNVSNMTDSTDVVKKCSRNLKNIIIEEEELGSGSYGVVTQIKADLNGKPLDMAMKKMTLDSLDPNALNKMTFEIEYSYLMGQVGIGPVVYDSFYTTINNKYVQYIFMELGLGTVEILFRGEDKYIKKYAIEQMIEITRKQIMDYNMYCTDIKPENFIYYMHEGCYSIKMIDFGIDLCSTELKTGMSKQDIFVYVNIQLFNYLININNTRTFFGEKVFFDKIPLFNTFGDDTKLGLVFVEKMIKALDKFNIFMRYIGAANNNASIYLSIARINQIYRRIHGKQDTIKHAAGNNYCDIPYIEKFQALNSCCNLVKSIKLVKDLNYEKDGTYLKNIIKCTGIYNGTQIDIIVESGAIPKSELMVYDYAQIILKDKKVLEMFYVPKDVNDYQQFIIYKV